MLWLSSRIRPSLRLALVSMALSDLLIVSVAAVWGPHLPCWPAMYVIASTILISYFSTVVLALHNYVAVFYHLRYHQILSLGRSVVLVVSSWLAGLSVSLACLGVHIPMGSFCYVIVIMPRVGIIVESSICLLCCCFVIYLNVRVFINIRRRTQQSVKTISRPTRDVNQPPTMVTDTGSVRNDRASFWVTRSSSVTPIPYPDVPLSSLSRSNINSSVERGVNSGFEHTPALRLRVPREPQQKEESFINVPMERSLSQISKYSSNHFERKDIQRKTSQPSATSVTKTLSGEKCLNFPISFNRAFPPQLNQGKDSSSPHNNASGKIHFQNQNLDETRDSDAHVTFHLHGGRDIKDGNMVSAGVHLDTGQSSLKTKEGFEVTTQDSVDKEYGKENPSSSTAGEGHKAVGIKSPSRDDAAIFSSDDSQSGSSRSSEVFSLSRQSQDKMSPALQEESNSQRNKKVKVMRSSRMGKGKVSRASYLKKIKAIKDDAPVLLTLKDTTKLAFISKPLWDSNNDRHVHGCSSSQGLPLSILMDKPMSSLRKEENHIAEETNAPRVSDTSSSSQDLTGDTSTTSQNTRDIQTGVASNTSHIPNRSGLEVSTQRSVARTPRKSWRHRTQITLLILCSTCCLISLPYVVYGGYVAIWVETRVRFITSGLGMFVSSLAGLSSITNPLLYAWRFVEWRPIWRKWRRSFGRRSL